MNETVRRLDALAGEIRAIRHEQAKIMFALVDMHPEQGERVCRDTTCRSMDDPHRTVPHMRDERCWTRADQEREEARARL